MATSVDVEVPSVNTATPLTALDRCDRCGAQAYLRVDIEGTGGLLFCAHHANEHADALKKVAAGVHDETHKLLARPTD